MWTSDLADPDEYKEGELVDVGKSLTLTCRTGKDEFFLEISGLIGTAGTTRFRIETSYFLKNGE